MAEVRLKPDVCPSFDVCLNKRSYPLSEALPERGHALHMPATPSPCADPCAVVAINNSTRICARSGCGGHMQRVPTFGERFTQRVTPLI